MFEKIFGPTVDILKGSTCKCSSCECTGTGSQGNTQKNNSQDSQTAKVKGNSK